jgi:hypothetical protein
MSETNNIIRGWRDRARGVDHSDLWILPGLRQFPPDHVMSWQLHGKIKQDEERKRRLNIARLEVKNGIREKPWF